MSGGSLGKRLTRGSSRDRVSSSPSRSEFARPRSCDKLRHGTRAGMSNRNSRSPIPKLLRAALTKSKPALPVASTPVTARSRLPVWLMAALLLLVTIALYWPLRRFELPTLDCDHSRAALRLSTSWPLVREKLPFFALAAGNSGGASPPEPPCTLERERVQEGPGHEGDSLITEPEQAHTLTWPGSGPKNGVHLTGCWCP